jgi:hypothetical protein
MGLFNFFKSPEQRRIDLFKQLKRKHDKMECKSQMQEIFIMSPHDDSGCDYNPKGFGRFGLDKTNPVPINGIDNIEAYMDKLRYEHFLSQSGQVVYIKPIFQRTSVDDKLKLGELKSNNEIKLSSLEVENILGLIDIYNIYSIENILIAKLYINVYSLKTSNNIPEGFYHRDKIPILQDARLIVEESKLLLKKYSQ